MNTQSNDDDRYEIYVGMFGDVHLIDKKSLSSRIMLPLINFGWFLVLLYILVPIALVFLVTFLWVGNDLVNDILSCDISTLFGWVVCFAIAAYFVFGNKKFR